MRLFVCPLSWSLFFVLTFNIFALIIIGDFVFDYPYTFASYMCCLLGVVWLGMLIGTIIYRALDRHSVILDSRKGILEVYRSIWGSRRFAFDGAELLHQLGFLSPSFELPLAEIAALYVAYTPMRFTDSFGQLKRHSVYEIHLLTHGDGDYVVSQDGSEERAYKVLEKISAFLNVKIVNDAQTSEHL